MIKKEFRIVALQAFPAENVMVTLSPIYYYAVPEEGEEPSNAEKVLAGPARQSEGEKALLAGVSVVIQEMERRGMLPPGASAPRGPYLPMVALLLSKAEYEELGKPTPNETILLTVTLEREPEPKPPTEALHA
jgi:hypothetical protein